MRLSPGPKPTRPTRLPSATISNREFSRHKNSFSFQYFRSAGPASDFLFASLASSPFKNAFFCRSSRGNEAHFSNEIGMIREPPYVGCYFFNSLLGRSNWKTDDLLADDA